MAKKIKQSRGNDTTNQTPPLLATRNSRWWTLKKNEIPYSVVAVVEQLRQNQYNLLHQCIASARLYGNLPAFGLGTLSSAKVNMQQPALRARITYNVCQSAVDTVVAKLCKSKPKPMFLTSRGTSRLQRKAKKLQQFADGCFYENKIHQLARYIFRDAAVFGTGAVHVFERDGRVTTERVLMHELLVDDQESFYGPEGVRQLHWVKVVDRFQLAALFPEHKTAIMRVAPQKPYELSVQNSIADGLTVIESWHLPSSPEAKDGLHTVVIGDSEPLLVEPYTKDHFPFAFMDWSRKIYGFWGQGAVEQIQNIQFEINKILWTIQRSMQLMGTFKIAMENTSKILKTALNNDIGTIIPFDRTPPQYMTPPIVQPELYTHLQTLKNSAFEQLGVSQLSAASKKPDGLDSGKALREYNDIESDRFAAIGQQYEQFHLDITSLMVETARDIANREGSYKVQYMDRNILGEIDWKDIDLQEDEYVMQVYPVSSLPDDPAGRLQTIQEYAQAGYLNPQQARRLLDFPDLQAVEDKANAQEDLANKQLDSIVCEGKILSPEPTQDLQILEKMTLDELADASLNDVSPAKLQMLNDFLEQVRYLSQQAQAAAQPPPQAGPTPAAAGIAQPATPPTSNLLPFPGAS